MMDREFTPREKGMLLVLAVLLLALGYMKLFYAPVQQAVEDNQQRQTELQDQALIEQTRALKMQVMEKELEELKAGKKQEAENALQAWKDGDATEDSFAALANELSDDTGSNTNGGLYKQVYKGQMVSEFNDWCFNESRKAGDTGIVANDATGGSYIGYHVMYFVGTDDPYWMVQVRNAMTNKAYSEWSANLVKDITATENSGMKYVG